MEGRAVWMTGSRPGTVSSPGSLYSHTSDSGGTGCLDDWLEARDGKYSLGSLYSHTSDSGGTGCLDDWLEARDGK